MIKLAGDKPTLYQPHDLSSTGVPFQLLVKEQYSQATLLNGFNLFTLFIEVIFMKGCTNGVVLHILRISQYLNFKIMLYLSI